MSAPRSSAVVVLAEAARAVSAVVDDGRAADAALAGSASLPEHAAIRAVTLGSLRWYLRLEPRVTLLTQGKALTPWLRGLLVTALHQLQYSRNPHEAIVSSAVDAARRLRASRAAGLVNAVLRRALRESEALAARFTDDIGVETAHPSWLVDALRAAWPAHWQAVLAANNAHPPLWLRVDRSRSNVDDYLAELAARGLAAQAAEFVPGAVRLEQPMAVNRIPGFAEGRVSVQDIGAQLACALLQVRAGERVLDACAAPGGKTGALLEAADGALDLTAVDIDAARLARVADNLTRLARSARLIAADLGADPSWWDGRPFDRILLDAPCSGSGVIRRHPDIKLLRRPEDIDARAAAARAILTRCLALLRPGGRLLYCTCSVLPAENEQVIAATLAAHRAVRVVPLQQLTALPADLQHCVHGGQLLPGNAAQSDGFYYACLTAA